jgi:hypothetical protein
MPTKKRPTLAEFSPEVLADDIKGEKLHAQKRASNEAYRNLISAPVEDRAERIARIANGESVEPSEDRNALRRAAAGTCHDLEEACELHHRRSLPIRHKALSQLCKALKPEHDAILRRIATPLAEAAAVLPEFIELKDYLLQQGGVVGICLTRPEKLLGSPTDRASDLAMLLREFVGLGVLDRMPSGLA